MDASSLQIGQYFEFKGSMFRGRGVILYRNLEGHPRADAAALGLTNNVEENHKGTWVAVPEHRLPLRVSLSTADLSSKRLQKVDVPIDCAYSAADAINGLGVGAQVLWLGALFRGMARTADVKDGKLRIIVQPGDGMRCDPEKGWVELTKEHKVLLTDDDIQSERFTFIDLPAKDDAVVIDNNPFAAYPEGTTVFLNGEKYRGNGVVLGVDNSKLRVELDDNALKLGADAKWGLHKSCTITLTVKELDMLFVRK